MAQKRFRLLLALSELVFGRWSLGSALPFDLFHRQHFGRPVAGSGRQFGNATEQIDRHALRPATKNDTLGFLVFGDQPILLFLNGDYFRWFFHAHSIG